jgi:hypothetical protein
LTSNTAFNSVSTVTSGGDNNGGGIYLNLDKEPDAQNCAKIAEYITDIQREQLILEHLNTPKKGTP